ncbi:MAG: hypothetical protein NVS9B10_08500 [Nevskia sp.]
MTIPLAPASAAPPTAAETAADDGALPPAQGAAAAAPERPTPFRAPPAEAFWKGVARFQKLR